MTKIAAIALIFVIGLIAYLPSFECSFHLDDEFFILDNAFIRDITDFEAIKRSVFGQHTRIVTFYTFAINYHFSQLDPFGYHVFNFGIHLITTLLIWCLVHLLFETPRLKDDKLKLNVSHMAFAVALLFCVHPALTQAITYITQRFESLATLFYLAVMCFYLKGRTASTGFGRWGSFVCAFICLALAVFTKEIVITIPLMIAVFELTLFNQNDVKAYEKRRQVINWFRKYGIFVIPIAFYLITIPSQKTYGIINRLTHERISASHEGDVFTFGTYIMTQFRVLVTFLKLLTVPTGLSLDHDFPASKSLFELKTLLSVTGILGLAVASFKLRKVHICISLGIWWFLLALSPNFVPREHVIFEHKMYLPAFGFLLTVCTALVLLLKGKVKFVSTVLAVCCVFSVMTFQRNQIWRDDFTLWSDIVKKSPEKFRPNYNMGKAYYDRKEFDKAWTYVEKALTIRPDSHLAMNTRGMLHMMDLDIDAAYDDFTYAILNANNTNPNAYNNRGNIYKDTAQYELALWDFEQAIAAHGNFDAAHNNRGDTYRRMGRMRDALDDFTRSIEINPDFVDGYNNRANLYKEMGFFKKALQDYTRAIANQSDNAVLYFNRALLLIDLERPEAALDDFDRSIRLNREWDLVYFRRGGLLMNEGNFEAARLDYNKTLDLNPDFLDAYINRSAVHQHQKNYQAALEDLGKAYKLNAEHSIVINNFAVVYFLMDDMENCKKYVALAKKLGTRLDPSLIEELNAREAMEGSGEEVQNK